MAQDSLKVSTRTILALVQAKKLRAAAGELKQLEPMRQKIYGYDRLVAAIHSPMTRAEKFFFEAEAMVPDLVDTAQGDAATRGVRIRGAIRRLMKARMIIRDAPEINDMLKRCLATLQEAENKVSAAQGLAMRGDWALAYKEIREAAQLDDSPEVKETRKFIAEQYRIHSKDEENVRQTWRVAKIGFAALVAVLVAVLMTKCYFRSGVDTVRREEAYKQRKRLAAAGMQTAPARPAPTSVAPPPAPSPASSASPPSAADVPAPIPAPTPVVPEPAAEKAVEIQADAPAGTGLGALPPGTKITLRYQAGVWMPWRAKAGFSPDAPSEAGKRHCLAIRGRRSDGTFKTLQVVPFRTKDAPFTYEVIGNYDAVSLVMNDDDGNVDNNDGTVTYELTVTAPRE